MGDIVTELTEWKSRQEGQNALARLKGLVKKVHRDSQGCAQGLVVGAYEIFLQVLFQSTDAIVPSRKLDTSTLLLNNDYLDTIIQVSTYLNVTLLIFDVQFSRS
jgi:hypothetical protein